MAQVFLRGETPTEFFRELVETTMRRQHVIAGDLTSYYLVNLLVGSIKVSREGDAALGDATLAEQLGRALESSPIEQAQLLRQLGDASLFIAGFFSDSLNRKLVDVDYYATMGGYAYSSLGRFHASRALAEIFCELAEKFTAFADVFGEISERTALSSNRSLLRLYEKWLRTGSRRLSELLVERGVVPNASIGRRFLQ